MFCYVNVKFEEHSIRFQKKRKKEEKIRVKGEMELLMKYALYKIMVSTEKAVEFCWGL